MSVLDDIIFNKRQEVTVLAARLDAKKIKELLNDLPRPRDFLGALSKGKLSLIAEIKQASPSAGVIAAKFEPVYL
ncbi:MAG: indole-3-glycerol-phosphate synthase TrpC, partial [Candidatus Margulisbacteria bacterium]|nr:indole-3-glycerol-phosphate synthase TrpC [Candidatus Margulisiibacteriota bacterium]